MQQKVTPRRGGETRQKVFKTRQVCEGADHRVAVKRNDIITYQNTVPRKKPKPPKAFLLDGGGFRMKTGGRLSSARHTQRACRPQGSLFKKRPCGPVLKARQQKPPAPGAPRGWVTVSLVTGRGLSLRTDAKRTENAPSFFSARFLAAALIEGYCL